MRTVTTELEGVSPLGMSKHYEVEKLEGEDHLGHEKRTWRERLHYDEEGIVFIPAMAFKKSLAACVKHVGTQIPGKGKERYTKHFEAGIIVPECVSLGIHKDDVDGVWLFVPSDGKPGGGKRVNKRFPYITKWKGSVTWYIVDDAITKEAFEKHLDLAGKLSGILFFRPNRGGYWGRFKVNKTEWSNGSV